MVADISPRPENRAGLVATGEALAAVAHFVKVVDDGTLATGDGWALARCESTDDLYFLVERSAASDERTLHNAWTAAAQLVIEEAVREGIVAWVREPARA